MAAIAAPAPDAAPGFAPAPRLSLLLVGAVGGGAAAGASVSLALTNDAISARAGRAAGDRVSELAGSPSPTCSAG